MLTVINILLLLFALINANPIRNKIAAAALVPCSMIYSYWNLPSQQCKRVDINCKSKCKDITSATCKACAIGQSIIQENPASCRLTDKRLKKQFQEFAFHSRQAYAHTLGTTYLAKSASCNLETRQSIYKEYYHQDSTASAYIAINKDEQKIIVSFKGTNTMSLAFHDLAIIQKGFGQDSEDVKIHSGFLSLYRLLKSDGIIDDLEELHDKYPHYWIAFTGHSLGGALASLAAVDYYKRHPKGMDPDKIQLVTFGMPRVGNDKWSKMVNSLPFSKNIYRIVAVDDEVARMPPAQFMLTNYDHFGRVIIVGNGSFYECQESSTRKDDANILNAVLNYQKHQMGYYYQAICD